jgi:hypothetical protein
LVDHRIATVEERLSALEQKSMSSAQDIGRPKALEEANHLPSSGG